MFTASVTDLTLVPAGRRSEYSAHGSTRHHRPGILPLSWTRSTLNRIDQTETLQNDKETETERGRQRSAEK